VEAANDNCLNGDHPGRSRFPNEPDSEDEEPVAKQSNRTKAVAKLEARGVADDDSGGDYELKDGSHGPLKKTEQIKLVMNSNLAQDQAQWDPMASQSYGEDNPYYY
jgi:hypothetical protein